MANFEAAPEKTKKGLFDFLYTDIAIDLGTANTLIYAKGEGLVLNEPSIVALNKQNIPVATGHQARLMHEKTHRDIRTIRPLRDGGNCRFRSC